MENSLFLNNKLKEYCRELKSRINLNRKILFVNCPQFDLNTFELEVAKNRCYYAYPPRSSLCLASAIKHRNFNVKILDLNYEVLKKLHENENFNVFEWMSIFKEFIEKENPSIVCISNMFNLDTPYFKKISEYLREKGNNIIIIGGQNATYNSSRFLNEGLCDFVCKRESEDKINFLFDNLYEDFHTSPVSGIFFKYNGGIEQSEGENKNIDLKENLIDSYKLIPVENYYKLGSTSPYSRMAGKDFGFCGILFNMGCSGGCKFCDVTDYSGYGIRSRNIKDFLDEMEYLYSKRGIRYFELLDDDFTRDNVKALEVLQGIINRKLNIKWGSTNGLIALTCSEEILEKMRDTGCLGFKIGVESGNPQILMEMRKPGTLKTFRRFSERAKKFPEMFIVDNYIIGLPNENFGQIMDSFNFSIEMDLDWSSYAVYQPNVSFSGKDNEREEENIEDFIPGKNVLEIKNESEDILKGPDIFKINFSEIPCKNQLNEIWFSFNLIRNFILNNNLKNNPEKFVAWVQAIQERYPTHPYINFFLSLSYFLTDKNEKAAMQYEKMKKNLEKEYWAEKFKEFELMGFVENFPKNKQDAKRLLDYLYEKYEKIVKKRRNRWVLITGSSKGLGKCLAETFSKNGYNIIIHGRDIEKLNEIKKNIESKGVECEIVCGDIISESVIENLKIISEEKNIDILINNVGIGFNASFNESEFNEHSRVLNINLISPIKLVKKIYPLFLKKGYGKIININSFDGLKTGKNKTAYSTSKYGLKGFTDSLRFEANDENIRVIGVYLAGMKTEMYEKFGGDTSKCMAPEEVAEIIFNASEDKQSCSINDLMIGRKRF